MFIKPKTAQEILDSRVWPEGEYCFECVAAQETLSKNSGAPMFVLTLTFQNETGQYQTIRDYITEVMEYKLRTACEAMKMMDVYNSGEIKAEDFLRRVGSAFIAIEKGKKREDGTHYSDKNVLKKYIVSDNINPNLRHNNDLEALDYFDPFS